MDCEDLVAPVRQALEESNILLLQDATKPKLRFEIKQKVEQQVGLGGGAKEEQGESERALFALSVLVLH